MAGNPVSDILSVDVDSNEVKLLSATILQSLQAAGPDGFIVFSTTEAIIPGPVESTASLALTASFVDGGSF